MDQEDDVFEIERVLESSITKGVRYYRVRWKGFGEDEDTWEPEENLFDCKDVLDKYWKENKNTRQTKVGKRKSESTPQTSTGSKAKKKRKGRTTNNSTIARIDSTPSHDKKVLFTNEKSARRTKTARKSASKNEIHSVGKHKASNQANKSAGENLGNSTRKKKHKKAIANESLFENNVNQVPPAKPVLDENQNPRDTGEFILPKEITPVKSIEDKAACNSTSCKTVSPNSTSCKTESPNSTSCKTESPNSTSCKTESRNSTNTETESPLPRENPCKSLQSPLQHENARESPHAKTDSPLQHEDSRESPHAKTDSPLQRENSRESPHAKTDSPLQNENSRESPYAKTDSPLQNENSRESPHAKTDSPLQHENSRESPHANTESPLQRENSSESPHAKTESPLQRGNSRESLHTKTDSPLQHENSRESLHAKTESPLQRENSRESLKIRRSWSSFEVSPEYVPEYCDETLSYDICSEEEYEYFGDTGYLVKDSVGYEEGDYFEPTKELTEDEGHVDNEGETKAVLSENEEGTEKEDDEQGNDKIHADIKNNTEAVSPEKEIRTEEGDDELTDDNGHVDNEGKTEEQMRTRKPKRKVEEEGSEMTNMSSLDTPTSILEVGHSLSSSSSRNIGINEGPRENDTQQLKKVDCEVTSSTATELFSKTEASKKSGMHGNTELNTASGSCTDEVSDVLKTSEKDDIRFTKGFLPCGKSEKVDHAKYPKKDDLKVRTRLSSSDSAGLADNECMSPEFEPLKPFFNLANRIDDGNRVKTLKGEKESKGDELGEDSCKVGPGDSSAQNVCSNSSCHELGEQACAEETKPEGSESISNALVQKTALVPDKDQTDIMEKENESDTQSVLTYGGENKPIDHPLIPDCDKLNSVVELKRDSLEVDKNSPQNVLDISQGKSRTDLNVDVQKKTSPKTSLPEIDNEKPSTLSIEAVVSQSSKPDVSEVIVISDDIEKPSGSSSRYNKKNRTKLRLSLKRKSDQSNNENFGKKSKQLPSVEKDSQEVCGPPKANTKLGQEMDASTPKLNKDKLSEIRSDLSVCEEKETHPKTGEKVNYLVESVIAIKQLNQGDLEDWSVNVDSDINMETDSQEKIVEPVGVTQKLFRPESPPVCELFDSPKKKKDKSVESKCTETVKSVDHLEETAESSSVEKLVSNTQARSTLASDESTINLKDSTDTDSSSRVGCRLVNQKMKQKFSEDLIGTKSKPIEICDDNFDKQEDDKKDDRKDKQQLKIGDLQCEEKTLEKEKAKISRIGNFFQKIKNKMMPKHSSTKSETDLKDERLSSTGKTLATDREELPASVRTFLPSSVPPKRSIESDADHISTAAKNVGQPALNTFEKNLEKNTSKIHPINVKQGPASDTSKAKEPNSLYIEDELDSKDQYIPPAEETSDLLTKQSSSDLSKNRMNTEAMKRTLSSSNGTSNIGHCSISAKKPSFSPIADQNIKCNAHQTTSIIFPNIEKDKTNMASKQNVSTSDALLIEEQFSSLTKSQSSPVLKGKPLPATEASRVLLTDWNVSKKQQDFPVTEEADNYDSKVTPAASIVVERKSFSSVHERSLARPEIAHKTTPEPLPNIIKKDTLPFPNEQLSSVSASGGELKDGKIEDTITGSVALSSMEKTIAGVVSSQKNLTTTPKGLTVTEKKNIHLQHVQTTEASSVSLKQNLPSSSHEREVSTTVVHSHQKHEQYKRGDDSISWSGDTRKTYSYSAQSGCQPPAQSGCQPPAQSGFQPSAQSSFQSGNHVSHNPFLTGANPSLVSQTAFLTQQSSPFSSYFNQQSVLTQPGNPSTNLARQKPFSAVAGLNWYPDSANQPRPRQFRFITPQPFVQRPLMSVSALYPRYAQPAWYNNVMHAARALQEMAQRVHPKSSTPSVSTSTGFNNKGFSSSIDADRAWYAKHVGSTASQRTETEPKAGENIKSQEGIKILRQSDNIKVSISESKGKDVFSPVFAQPHVGKNIETDTMIITESLSQSKHGELMSSSSLGESLRNENDSSSKDIAREGNTELSNVAKDTSVTDEKLKTNSGSRFLQQSGNHSPDTGKKKDPASTEKDKSLSEKEILKETSEKDTVSKLSGNGSLNDGKKPSDENGNHRTNTETKQQYQSKNKAKEKSEGKLTLNSESYKKSISRSAPDSKSQSALKETKKSNHKTNEKSEKSSEKSGSRAQKDREHKERRNDFEKTRAKDKEISQKKEDSSKTCSRANADDRRSKRDSKKNISELKKQDSLDSELEFDLDDYSPGEVVNEKPEKANVLQLGIPTALPLREVKSAIKQGDSATVLASLAGGMNIDSQDSLTGMSLLSRAVSSGQENIVRLLLNHGANINIKDITGSTPLIEACEQGFENIVSLLLNAEIDINAKQTLSGETALIKACMKGYYSVVAMLLAHGADCQMRSVSGLTAAQLAVQCGHFEIRDLLESHNKKLQRCVETAIASCLCDSSKLMYPPLLPFVSLYPAEGQRFTYHFHCSDLLLDKTIVLFCLRAVFSRSGQVDLSFSKDNGVHTVLLNGSLQSPVLLNNKSVFVLQPKLETNRLILQTYQSHVHLLVCIYAAEIDEKILNIESGPT